jgi:hypothetical protein
MQAQKAKKVFGARAQGRGAGWFGIGLAMLAGVAVAGTLAARHRRRQRTRTPARDYSDRSGFPRPAAEMRGAASDEKRLRRSWLPEALGTQTLTGRASG